MYRTPPCLNAVGSSGVVRGMLTLAALLALNLVSPTAAPRADNPDGGEKKKKKGTGDESKEEECRLRFVVAAT